MSLSQYPKIARYIDLNPIAKLRAGQYAVIAIELTSARLAEYKGRGIGDTGIFTEI